MQVFKDMVRAKSNESQDSLSHKWESALCCQQRRGEGMERAQASTPLVSVLM